MDIQGNLVGKTIDKYQIVELLGKGGMAEVYKANQINLDRHVALKLMHAFLADDPDFIARFEREAKNVAGLRHPNIVQVYDFDVVNGMPYMVMEYIEGETLKAHLENMARRGESMSLGEALRIIQEIGRALAYAHKRGMIHRDIKPANVMMDVSGRAILTDFGIAKILTGPSHTATGTTIGTPDYMAPEQGMGRAGDNRSDIYSLGVMLYQLATGQLPYQADTPLAVMLKHVNDPLPSPRSLKPDLPEGVERVILKSMAKNAEERFATVDDMLASLSNLETAARLTLPAVSMAGVSSSASTRAVPVTGTTMAGATQARPIADTRQADKARPALPITPAVAIIAVLLILGVGGGALYFGGALGPKASPTPLPTSTQPPATQAPLITPSATSQPATETPNSVATQLAILQATQQAILATPTFSPSPDLTQTALACTYAYKISAQDPPDGRTLAVNSRPISKTVTLENTGTCAFPDGTQLVEVNLPTSAAPQSVTVEQIEPGDNAPVAFNWPALKAVGTTTRTWELHLPDGTVVGEALTFTFKYAVISTPTPPLPPPPTPAPVTPTSAAAGLTSIYPASVIGCVYQGTNNMDYNCTFRLGYSGGVGPFTLYYEGQRIGFFQPGETMYYNVVGRRCFVAVYNLRLVDDGSVTQVSTGFQFDPNSAASAFPGGQCTP
jgi:serine/threonine-protein kinase